MKAKEGALDNGSGKGHTTFIVWSEKYDTGIELIDKQHRELVDLINQLYDACLHRGTAMDATFKKAMHRMVEYVRFHLSAEVEMLEKIVYPNLVEHKKQHDELIQKILKAAQDYEKGSTLVPNKFVRTLRDWVLSHIAVYDKAYAEYIAERKKALPNGS